MAWPRWCRVPLRPEPPRLSGTIPVSGPSAADEVSTGMQVRPSIWRPLDSKSFRVLRIIRNRPRIYAELVEVTHRGNNKYYALSYAWGKHEATETITCNGEPTAVSPHLYEGICCIFDLYGHLDIFIDAICINQDNDLEKAEQVANMHLVYKGAAKVLVWLGKSTDDSDVAMNFIRSAQGILPETPEVSSLSTGNHSLHRKWFVGLSPRLKISVWKLGLRSWFTRLWIVQEIWNVDNVSFICGRIQVEGPLFLQVGFSLSQLDLAYHLQSAGVANLEPIPETEMHGWQYLRELRISRDTCDRTYVSNNRFSASNMSYPYIVNSSRSRFAQEPVDHIYALLGLDDSEGAYFQQNIHIDYSASVRKNYLSVYVQFAKLAISKLQGLALLRYTSSRDRPQGLPSWCPNLRSRVETSRIVSTYFAGSPSANHLSPRREPGKHAQCALRHPNFLSNLHVHAVCLPDSNRIAIWGAFLDTIIAVGPEYLLKRPRFVGGKLCPISVAERFESIENWLKGCVQLVNAGIRNAGPKISSSLDRTILADLALYGDLKTPCSLDDIAHLHMFVRYLELFRQHFQETRTLPRAREPYDNEIDLIAATVPIAQIFARLETIWQRRSFFVTSGGRMGYASARVKTGDSICAFYTGSSIYVLRQNPDSSIYEFIDDGYTHGLMQGETFDLLDAGLVEEQLFEIE